MGTSTLEKNIVPQLGVSELWLVAFHATTSLPSLSVSSAPIQTLNNSLHSSKVPAASPGSPPSPLCEEHLNQGKPKQCTMDPPLPPMIRL